MNLFEQNKEQLEAFEKKRKEEDKAFKNYCSPSRLVLFNNDKRMFLQKYFFKRDKKSSAALTKGKLNHAFLYSLINEQSKDFIVMPDFGHKGKIETKKKTKDFIEKNKDRTIFEPEQEGMFIALRAFLKTNPILREALTEAVSNNFQGVEKRLTSENPNVKCYADLLYPKGILDIKTTFKSDWLNDKRGYLFFKYEEEKKCIQAVMNLYTYYETFGKEGGFYWMLCCNQLPYGFKLVMFERDYLTDIGKIVFNIYMKRYEEFVDRVKQIVGYNFLEKDKYEGSEIDDWVKFNSILVSDDDRKDGVEIIAPSVYARQQADIFLGYN